MLSFHKGENLDMGVMKRGLSRERDEGNDWESTSPGKSTGEEVGELENLGEKLSERRFILFD